MKIEFEVIGVPKGAGSKHAFALKKNGQYTGRVVVTDTSGKAGKSWRASIVQAAFEAMKAQNILPFSESLILRAEFVMPRPRSHYRTGKLSHQLRDDAPIVHSCRPDATKLVRQLEDSLTKVLWIDDALVCELHAYKKYGHIPGCKVTVTTHAEESLIRQEMPRYELQPHT